MLVATGVGTPNARFTTRKFAGVPVKTAIFSTPKTKFANATHAKIKNAIHFTSAKNKKMEFFFLCVPFKTQQV